MGLAAAYMDFVWREAMNCPADPAYCFHTLNVTNIAISQNVEMISVKTYLS
jgi:hypothetical protein